jgi:deoxyhypusine monooxygenase
MVVVVCVHFCHVCACSSSTSSSLLAIDVRKAAYVLGQMQNQAVVAQLIAVVDRDDEEPMVRHEAAESLGAIGTTEAMDRLTSLQHDRHQVVHESCVVALDIMDYYSSQDFQYADALQKVVKEE